MRPSVHISHANKLRSVASERVAIGKGSFSVGLCRYDMIRYKSLTWTEKQSVMVVFEADFHSLYLDFCVTENSRSKLIALVLKSVNRKLVCHTEALSLFIYSV